MILRFFVVSMIFMLLSFQTVFANDRCEHPFEDKVSLVRQGYNPKKALLALSDIELKGLGLVDPSSQIQSALFHLGRNGRISAAGISLVLASAEEGQIDKPRKVSMVVLRSALDVLSQLDSNRFQGEISDLERALDELDFEFAPAINYPKDVVVMELRIQNLKDLTSLIKFGASAPFMPSFII